MFKNNHLEGKQLLQIIEPPQTLTISAKEGKLSMKGGIPNDAGDPGSKKCGHDISAQLANLQLETDPLTGANGQFRMEIEKLSGPLNTKDGASCELESLLKTAIDGAHKLFLYISITAQSDEGVKLTIRSGSDANTPTYSRTGFYLLKSREAQSAIAAEGPAKWKCATFRFC